MVDTAAKRKEFRERLSNLSTRELLQRAFLIGLIQRIDNEFACYTALFEPDSEVTPTPAADAQLAGIALIIQQELARRGSVARTKARLQKEGEDHANHAENGNH